MQLLFNLLRNKGLYMIRALLDYPQEAPNKRHLAYCVRVMSVGCPRIEVELVKPTDNTHAIYQVPFSLVFVPCIIRRSKNNQHYALNCTTHFFNIQYTTCFGSGLPSSGSFFDSSELLEKLIE
jgi:hypothetical protein